MAARRKLSWSEVDAEAIGRAGRANVQGVKGPGSISSQDDTPKEIRVEMPYIRPDIPIFILFKALGYNHEQAMDIIRSTIISDKFFTLNI